MVSKLLTLLLVASVVMQQLLVVGVEGSTRRARASRQTKVHEDSSLVLPASLQNFRERVMDPTVPVLVALYNLEDSSSSKTIESAIDEVAQHLTNFAEFVYLDGNTEDGKQIQQMFGVQRLPTVMLFNPELVPVPGGQEGQLMKMPLGYEGDASASSLLKFILTSTSMSQLERVSDDHELADFFTKFSNLDMPHFLYFTSQGHVSPMFVGISHLFRYGGVFGVAFANNSAEIQKRYNVKQFPTLLALVSSSSSADEVIAMEGLTKETTFEQLKSFVEQYALPFERQQVIRPSIYLEEEKLRVKEAEHAKMVKALPPMVISTRKQWVRECLTRKKGNCMAVFVDSVQDDSVPFEMLFNVSRKIAAKSSVPLQIAVVDGLTNYEIVNFFGMVNGLPDAVVIVGAKRQYMNLVGSVTERGLTNFYFDKALKNIGVKTFKAKKVPKFKKTPRAVDEDEISDEL